MNKKDFFKKLIDSGLQHAEHQHSDAEILDSFWSGEIDSFSRNFKPEIDLSSEDFDFDFAVSLAGKIEGPDQKVKEVAFSVLKNFEFYYNSLYLVKKSKEGGNDDHWSPLELWVPYQEEAELFYIVIISMHGAGVEYAFVKDKPHSENFSVYLTGLNMENSIIAVPSYVKYTLKKLKDAGLNENSLNVLLDIIKKNKTMGRKLIAPLISIVSENRELLGEDDFNSCLKRLESIRGFAF